MGINNPIPRGLKTECKKAANILASFTKPNQVFGADQVIPPAILQRAQGLAIITVFKAGFLFSGRAGSGILIARKPNGNGWTAPSAIALGGAGAGGMAGLELTDFVFILNTREAVSSFSQFGTITLGGNVSVAAGPLGRNAEAASSISTGGIASVFSYSKSKGLYAGVSLEGSILLERREANRKYYGDNCTSKQILSGRIRPPPIADPLIKVLNSPLFTGRSRDPNNDDYGDDYFTVSDDEQDSYYSSSRRTTTSNNNSRRYNDNNNDYYSDSDENYSDEFSYRNNSREGSYATEISSRSNNNNKYQSSYRPPSRRDTPTNNGSSSRYVDDNRYGSSDEEDDYYNSRRTESYTNNDSRRNDNYYNNDSRRNDRYYDEKRSSNDNRYPPSYSQDDNRSDTAIKASPSRNDSSLPKAVAMYNFPGQESGDLPFRKGDVINIIKKSESQNDWWTGRCNGKEGIFPANYVELV